MNIYQGQLDEDRKEKEQKKRSSVDSETIEESCGASPFPNTRMSTADRYKKTGATDVPQHVPWPNSNEARRERLNLGVKGVLVPEDQGCNQNLVSSSRVQATAGAPPAAVGAPGSSTRIDEHAQGATNWRTQGQHNGERVPGGTNSSRREHGIDERVPGAFLMPGFHEEGISRHNDDQSFSDHSQYSEGGRNESDERSPHAVIARVVDPEEDHRVLREQLHQVLREQRAQAHVAVVHPASTGSGMEHGNKSVVHAPGSNSDGDVERGNMIVGQAPIININASVNQSPTMNVGPPKTGGCTRGRFVFAALILVIVAVAIGVTLPLVLPPEPDKLKSSVSTPSPTPEQAPEITLPPTSPPASSQDNGDCSSAWPTLVDGAVTVGSNANGTVASSCSTYSDDYGPVAWYRFIGTGRPIKVSTCNKRTEFATVLSVLSSTDGACGPDKLECVGTASGFDSSYLSGCPSPESGSTVSIDATTPNSVYYASVIGHEGAVGEFGLTIFDDSAGCKDDKELHPVDGKIYAGTNVNGMVTSACDIYSDDYGSGTWYRFIGTGRPIKVSTCNANTTGFATVLSVFSSKNGTCSPDKLECLGTASGFDASYSSGCLTPESGSTVSIGTTSPNSVYYASVIGHEGAVGEFGLTIFDDSAGCKDDKELHPVDGKIYAGTNVNGLVTSVCDINSDDYGSGTWYRFIGTGRPIKVSTCNANTTDFATVLSVLSSTDGTCSPDKLECLETASGFDSSYSSGCLTPGSGSTVSFGTTSPNSVYYVSVIGHEGAVGEFGLTMFDDSTGCEDGKEAHPIDGRIYAGSNENGKYVSACDIYAGDYGPGSWYRFIGTGRPISVSTCNTNTTDFATVLSVLSSTDGTCSPDKLECVETASGFDSSYSSGCPAEVGSTGSMVSVDTIADRVYFASVIGHEGAVGEFGLMMFDDSPARQRILPEVLSGSFTTN